MKNDLVTKQDVSDLILTLDDLEPEGTDAKSTTNRGEDSGDEGEAGSLANA